MKQRLVVLLDEDEFEKLKSIAEEQHRPTGNLGAAIIKDFLKNYKG